MRRCMSPHMNRPFGRGFVVEVRGFGAATLSSVKYDDVDGGRIYTHVPVCHITSINFVWDFYLPRSQSDRIRPG